MATSLTSTGVTFPDATTQTTAALAGFSLPAQSALTTTTLSNVSNSSSTQTQNLGSGGAGFYWFQNFTGAINSTPCAIGNVSGWVSNASRADGIINQPYVTKAGLYYASSTPSLRSIQSGNNVKTQNGGTISWVKLS